MTKTKQAEIALQKAGYSIYYHNFKGKAYPHIEKLTDTGKEHHSDTNLIKLCTKVLPDIKLI